MPAKKGIDREKLLQTYKSLQNITHTAEALGIAFNTAKYHLRAAGVQTLKAKQRPPAVDRALRQKQPASPWQGL